MFRVSLIIFAFLSILASSGKFFSLIFFLYTHILNYFSLKQFFSIIIEAGIPFGFEQIIGRPYINPHTWTGSFDFCSEFCIKNPRCAGFRHSGSLCILYKDLNKTLPINIRLTTYKKKAEGNYGYSRKHFDHFYFVLFCYL